MMPPRLCTLAALVTTAAAFHDCIQPRSGPPRSFGGVPIIASQRLNAAGEVCSGGLCVGMKNGPHEGGNASYPVGNASVGFTRVSSTMTVPEPPQKQDGVTYYIWTDIFFGDMGYGRMNQFVPQLLLGSVLDGSSGAPDFKPEWHTHKTWSFGAHYFFETYNATTNTTEGHAAYGDLFPTHAGETLFTRFEQTPIAAGNTGTSPTSSTVSWELSMGVVGDDSRVSRVVVDKPYMGIGETWPEPFKTTSWNELNYSNLCVNSCWELYGATDRAHLPGNGSSYDIKIEQGVSATTAGAKEDDDEGNNNKEGQVFPWVTKWDEDEGADKPCPTSQIQESHTAAVQHVLWDISLPPPSSANESEADGA